MPREPQSYGSDQDWVSGRTGQNVNDPKSAPPEVHEEFYESRRGPETAKPDAPAEATHQHSAPPVAKAEGSDLPVQRVTSREGGAKRDSYFRRRDYDG